MLRRSDKACLAVLRNARILGWHVTKMCQRMQGSVSWEGNTRENYVKMHGNEHIIRVCDWKCQ